MSIFKRFLSRKDKRSSEPQPSDSDSDPPLPPLTRQNCQSAQSQQSQAATNTYIPNHPARTAFQNPQPPQLSLSSTSAPQPPQRSRTLFRRRTRRDRSHTDLSTRAVIQNPHPPQLDLSPSPRNPLTPMTSPTTNPYAFPPSPTHTNASSTILPVPASTLFQPPRQQRPTSSSLAPPPTNSMSQPAPPTHQLPPRHPLCDPIFRTMPRRTPTPPAHMPRKYATAPPKYPGTLPERRDHAELLLGWMDRKLEVEREKEERAEGRGETREFWDTWREGWRVVFES